MAAGAHPLWRESAESRRLALTIPVRLAGGSAPTALVAANRPASLAFGAALIVFFIIAARPERATVLYQRVVSRFLPAPLRRPHGVAAVAGSRRRTPE